MLNVHALRQSSSIVRIILQIHLGEAPAINSHMSTLLRAELTTALAGSVPLDPLTPHHPSLIQTGQSVTWLVAQPRWTNQGATPSVDMEQCSCPFSRRPLTSPVWENYPFLALSVSSEILPALVVTRNIIFAVRLSFYEG